MTDDERQECIDEQEALHARDDANMEVAKAILKTAASHLRLLGTLQMDRLADAVEELPDSRDWFVQ